MLLTENPKERISTKGAVVSCVLARLSKLYRRVESESFARRYVPRRSEAKVQHPRFIYVGERVS
jgi:hypothetical protein